MVPLQPPHIPRILLLIPFLMQIPALPRPIQPPIPREENLHGPLDTLFPLLLGRDWENLQTDTYHIALAESRSEVPTSIRVVDVASTVVTVDA